MNHHCAKFASAVFFKLAYSQDWSLGTNPMQSRLAKHHLQHHIPWHLASIAAFDALKAFFAAAVG